jgi:large subunit ribosomal protein L13
VLRVFVPVSVSTPSCVVTEQDRKWFLIDASGLVLGRLAVVVADILRGKHKPIFTRHNDCGDHVVIVNAEKVFLTGKKRQDKVYYRHSGYPGGLKQRTANQVLTGRFPERVIESAIEGMIPAGPLGRKVMKKLRIYAGESHPHSAQKLEVLDIASMNVKNAERGLA